MNWNEATWSLLGTVLSLVLGIGGAILIPKVRELGNSKIGVNNTTMLLDWAGIAVRAAEQVLGAGAGAEKYAFVLKALQSISDSHNIKVDATTLQAAIEASVHELKTGANTVPAAVGNVVVTQTPDEPVIVKEGV